MTDENNEMEPQYDDCDFHVNKKKVWYVPKPDIPDFISSNQSNIGCIDDRFKDVSTTCNFILHLMIYSYMQQYLHVF